MAITDRLPRLLTRFVSFASVGAVGTVAHYLVLWSLVEIGGVGVLPATTAGFVAGAVINYGLNRRITFASNAPHASALPKFLAVATAGAFLNAAMMKLFAVYTDLHYLLAQVGATIVVLVWNFGANALWTFRDRRD